MAKHWVLVYKLSVRRVRYICHNYRPHLRRRRRTRTSHLHKMKSPRGRYATEFWISINVAASIPRAILKNKIKGDSRTIIWIKNNKTKKIGVTDRLEYVFFEFFKRCLRTEFGRYLLTISLTSFLCGIIFKWTDYKWLFGDLTPNLIRQMICVFW